MTRSASITPSSMSFSRPEASVTLSMGTLRTSMGSGMGVSCTATCGDQRWMELDDRAGEAVDGVGGAVEGGDDGAMPARLDEADRRLDLRTHAAAGEVALRGERAQLLRGRASDGALARGAVGDGGALHVG